MMTASPGDSDRDGYLDLLARDSGDGMLWAYRGNGTGTFPFATRAEYGYVAAVRPLIASGGDANLDGRARHPGRKRHPDRLVLQGILFVLHTGIAWEHLPQELGFGSGMTCWRRLAEWTEAGVWPRLHEVLLADLRSANALDFSRAAVDGSHIRGPKTGRSPVDRGRAGRAGSKHHLIIDATGIPLAAP